MRRASSQQQGSATLLSFQPEHPKCTSTWLHAWHTSSQLGSDVQSSAVQAAAMNTLLRCNLQCFADLSLLLRSCRCIIWLQLSTSNKIMTSRASFGTALPTVALQTIVAPASSQGSSPYLYNLIGTTSQKGSPLQQLQFVWAECPPMPSNGSTATVDSPALQTFSLSSCRANPNQCNLTAAAAAATGGICSTRPVPELWAQSAYAYELCAAAGLGDTVDFVNCIGV